MEIKDDQESIQNLCTVKENDLVEVTLRDLIPDTIIPGSIIWLDVIGKSFRACITAVMLVVSDKNGDTISCPLYN